MSRETLETLNSNTLIGFTEKRGTAWHYRADLQGGESNHYTGPVPLADVERRLFHWDAIGGPVEATFLRPEGTYTVEDTSRMVVVRPDTWDVLGVHSAGYQIHQYREWLLRNVAGILSSDLGGLSIGSAGLLKNGAVAWVQVEVPDTIVTPEGVQFRPNLLACTSHDATIPTTYKRTVTNVVCDNTMGAGLQEVGQEFRIKHTRNSGLRLAEARDALAVVYSIADDFAAEVATLCQTTVTDKQWAEIVAQLAPLPEDKETGRGTTLAEIKRADLAGLWNNDPRVTPWKNTGWGVLQAVNTYTHHLQTVKNATRPERNMLRAVSGDVEKLDSSTLTLLSKVLATV